MFNVSITEVPAGMTPHTDDSSKFGYPPGVDAKTEVEVVIAYNGHLSLHRSQAASFGWQIEPHRPCSPGLSPCAAPITHFRIVA